MCGFSTLFWDIQQISKIYPKTVLLPRQVMVDNTGTTRLEWRAWDIFTKLPVGMVAYTEEHQFVARVKRGSSFRSDLGSFLNQCDQRCFNVDKHGGQPMMLFV